MLSRAIAALEDLDGALGDGHGAGSNGGLEGSRVGEIDVGEALPLVDFQAVDGAEGRERGV